MQIQPPQNAEHQISFNLFHSAHSLSQRSPSLSVLSVSLPLSSCCLPSLFGFLFGLSCSVHGICPQWGIAERWEDFYWAASSRGLVQRSGSFFQSGIRYKRYKIAWVCAFEHIYSLSSVWECVLVLWVLALSPWCFWGVVCIVRVQQCVHFFSLVNYQR